MCHGEGVLAARRLEHVCLHNVDDQIPARRASVCVRRNTLSGHAFDGRKSWGASAIPYVLRSDTTTFSHPSLTHFERTGLRGSDGKGRVGVKAGEKQSLVGVGEARFGSQCGESLGLEGGGEMGSNWDVPPEAVAIAMKSFAFAADN